MSAFIVSKSDMDAAVRVLVGSGEALTFGPMARRPLGDWTPTNLGRHLFEMNIRAVQERYGVQINDLPGPNEGASEYPSQYEAPDCTSQFLTPEEWTEGERAVSSLAYQCAEGDIPETWPAYNLLMAARDRIRPRAKQIAMKAAQDHERNRPSARLVDTKDSAKLLRTELKRRWPSAKFGVRIERYSMGSHITVRWTDGPTAREVDTVSEPYSAARFNSTDDSSYSVQSWLFKDGRAIAAGYNEPAPEEGAERVRFSGSRPHCYREISDAYEAKCARAWDALDGAAQCVLLNDHRFPRWPDDRPGYRLATFIGDDLTAEKSA